MGRTGTPKIWQDLARSASVAACGGPALREQLCVAALMPSAEELCDDLMRRDPTMSEAEALESGSKVREMLLDMLEAELVDGDG